MRAIGPFICLAALVVVVSAGSRYRRAAQTVKLVTAFVGSSVTFTCDTTLQKFDLVEWRRNDSANAIFLQYQRYAPTVDRRYLNRVVLKDKKNLQISNLIPGDEDVYFCKVVNSSPGATSQSGSPIKLIVLEKSRLTEAGKLLKYDAPRCVGAPAGLFVAKVVGSTGLLPCKVAGNPFPVIEWTKNNGVLPEGRYAVTNQGLTINHLAKEDSGYYQVTLKSIAGITEVVIQLIVKTTASVLPGHYIDAVEGQMQSIPCGRDKVTKDSKLTWKRSGADPTKNSRFTLDTSTGSLVINRVNRKDSGSYNCSVMKIENGRITFKTYEMYFNVQYRPDIIYHLIEETAIVNENVTLPCVAIGNPTANVTWNWKGKSVNNDSRFLVGPNGSLVIENVTRKDEGIYTCTPFNKWVGEKKTSKLVILVPPKFRTIPQFIQKVKAGENATFDCSASGIPPPNITWPPVWSPWPEKRMLTSKNGIRKIFGVKLSDYGRYRCVVVSNAGIITRDFLLFLIAKPYKPVNITTTPLMDAVSISWRPNSTGVIVQTFELWHRRLSETDYDWKFLDFRQSGNETAKLTGVLKEDSLIRLRGKNQEGLGPFSEPYKVFSNGSSVREIESINNEKTPLAPYKMNVNISMTGYAISWKTKFAPGRPDCSHFILETKRGNSSWVAIGGKISKTAREYLLLNSDIELGVLYSFRMYSVGLMTSEPAFPKVNYFGMPERPTSPAVNPGASKVKDSDPWPTIILAILFSVFVLILLISLICFLRATGRLGGNRSRRNQNGALLDEKIEEDNLMSDGKASKNSSNGVKLAGGKMFNKKNPKKVPFHYENCPIKLVSDYEGGDYQRLLLESSAAHVIFSESPEKCQCDHRRCMTLPRKPGPRIKKPKKGGLYKSVSSPNVITNSNGKVSAEHDLTAETVINDNDYDLYDSEDGDFVDSKFPTIDRKFSKMKNSKMIDSYDQFCRSPSDFGSKDLAGTPRESKQKPHNGDLYVSPHDDDDDDEAKQRMLSATESEHIELTEVKHVSELTAEPDRVELPDEEIRKHDEHADIQSDTGTPPEQGSKENVFDDPNDASSENSVTESDQRVFALTASRLRHPPAKPGYAMRTSSDCDDAEKRMSFDRGLTSIKETPSKASLNSIDKHSIRSYELRSSGIESEGKPHSYTSDTESVTNSIPPITAPYKFKDVDVMSDISTRSSPGPLRRSGPYLGYDEHYEWDLPKHRNYGRPIYQSPKKEKVGQHKEPTDNEDLFRSILTMQQQLGVDLADSWENLSEDTNLSLVCNSQTPFYRDGYASDVPSSFTDRVSAYSEREKARRCAELLQELKRNNPNHTAKPSHPIKRSLSAVNDYMRTRPVVPPFKRSNSTCEDETVFHEWLV